MYKSVLVFKLHSLTNQKVPKQLFFSIEVIQIEIKND